MDLERESEIYGNLMAEIRDRLAVALRKISDISRPYKGSSDLILATPEFAIEIESSILQIRFACELIALATLAAHSKVGLTKDLMKSWNADRTFRGLSDLNPKSFPQPWKGTHYPDGRVIFEPREALDKRGLIRIYERCGALLHRGVIAHILNDKKRIYDLPQLIGWVNDIQRLIAMHAILIERHNALLFVTMAPPDGNPINVAYGYFDPADDPAAKRYEFKESPNLDNRNR